MQNYEYVSTIGEGAYGEVWKCRNRTSGQVVAVKCIKQAHQDQLIMRLAVREAQILRVISHPNLVKLEEAFKSRSGRVYLIFEFVETSVHDQLEKYPFGLRSAQTKSVSWQLIYGVVYLHDNMILHRDIKPANILMSRQQGAVKLCDFGFARRTRCGPREVQRCTSYITTRWYRAPEVLIGERYGPSADVWSIGCTIAEIATGRPLFPGDSTADQLWRIVRCLGPLPRNQAAVVATNPSLRLLVTAPPPLFKTLRERLLEIDTELFELIAACLRLDPRQRPTARELLQFPCFADISRFLPSLKDAAEVAVDAVAAIAAAGLQQPLKNAAAAAAVTAAAAATAETPQQRPLAIKCPCAQTEQLLQPPSAPPQRLPAAAAQQQQQQLVLQRGIREAQPDRGLQSVDQQELAVIAEPQMAPPLDAARFTVSPPSSQETHLADVALLGESGVAVTCSISADAVATAMSVTPGMAATAPAKAAAAAAVAAELDKGSSSPAELNAVPCAAPEDASSELAANLAKSATAIGVTSYATTAPSRLLQPAGTQLLQRGADRVVPGRVVGSDGAGVSVQMLQPLTPKALGACDDGRGGSSNDRQRHKPASLLQTACPYGLIANAYSGAGGFRGNHFRAVISALLATEESVNTSYDNSRCQRVRASAEQPRPPAAAAAAAAAAAIAARMAVDKLPMMVTAAAAKLSPASAAEASTSAAEVTQLASATTSGGNITLTSCFTTLPQWSARAAADLSPGSSPVMAGSVASLYSPGPVVRPQDAAQVGFWKEGSTPQGAPAPAVSGRTPPHVRPWGRRVSAAAAVAAHGKNNMHDSKSRVASGGDGSAAASGLIRSSTMGGTPASGFPAVREVDETGCSSWGSGGGRGGSGGVKAILSDGRETQHGKSRGGGFGRSLRYTAHRLLKLLRGSQGTATKPGAGGSADAADGQCTSPVVEQQPEEGALMIREAASATANGNSGARSSVMRKSFSQPNLANLLLQSRTAGNGLSTATATSKLSQDSAAPGAGAVQQPCALQRGPAPGGGSSIPRARSRLSAQSSSLSQLTGDKSYRTGVAPAGAKVLSYYSSAGEMVDGNARGAPLAASGTLPNVQVDDSLTRGSAVSVATGIRAFIESGAEAVTSRAVVPLGARSSGVGGIGDIGEHSLYGVSGTAPQTPLVFVLPCPISDDGSGARRAANAQRGDAYGGGDEEVAAASYSPSLQPPAAVASPFASASVAATAALTAATAGAAADPRVYCDISRLVRVGASETEPLPSSGVQVEPRALLSPAVTATAAAGTTPGATPTASKTPQAVVCRSTFADVTSSLSQQLLMLRPSRNASSARVLAQDYGRNATAAAVATPPAAASQKVGATAASPDGSNACGDSSSSSRSTSSGSNSSSSGSRRALSTVGKGRKGSFARLAGMFKRAMPGPK